jgi:hypothetical protein
LRKRCRAIHRRHVGGGCGTNVLGVDEVDRVNGGVYDFPIIIVN